MGRRRLALLYCVLYVASCATRHFRHYWLLMLGRVLGGVATSLLFSVFDAWLVSEFAARAKSARDEAGDAMLLTIGVGSHDGESSFDLPTATINS